MLAYVAHAGIEDVGTDDSVVHFCIAWPDLFGVGIVVSGLVGVGLCCLGFRRLVDVCIPIRGGDLCFGGVGILELSIRNPAKSILLSLLGLLFLVNLNIAFEVPFVQRLQTCLPMQLNGAETQGQVVRVYMRETEKRDYLFHSQRTKQYLMPCAEYVFTTTEGRSYRGELSCGRIDEMHVGQMIPVRYLPDNPQMNRSGRFFDMWGDTLLFGTASLGALCLTWYIFTRHFLGRKRRPNKRFRHLRRG